MCNEVGSFFGVAISAYTLLFIVLMIVFIQHQLVKRR